MSDTTTSSWIAALERARAELGAELEVALSADVHRRTPREVGGDAGWAGYGRALEDNPVYRCWLQLSEAIEELRRQAEAQPRARAEVGAVTSRRRVSLRDVLEQIRADPVLLQGTELQATVVDGRRSEPSEAAPSGAEPPSTPSPAGTAMPPAGAGYLPPEAEGATVSFVIRELAPPTPAAGQDGDAPSSKQPAPRETPAAPEPEAALGAEAEVAIVPRRR